tara:strand:- start:267 stop:416 length:150 start_codon:yes stop_codon:yes gene_type:complete
MLLWFFDLITFKQAFLFWLFWAVLNLAVYGFIGATFYATLVAPFLSLMT